MVYFFIKIKPSLCLTIKENCPSIISYSRHTTDETQSGLDLTPSTLAYISTNVCSLNKHNKCFSDEVLYNGLHLVKF